MVLEWNHGSKQTKKKVQTMFHVFFCKWFLLMNEWFQSIQTQLVLREYV